MDIKETREEIIRRSKIVRAKQRQRVKKMLEGVSVVLVVMLVMVMRQVPFTMNTESNGYYGTLMLGSEAGIYIIVGLICFILGVLITLITIKYRDKDTETVNNENQ